MATLTALQPLDISAGGGLLFAGSVFEATATRFAFHSGGIVNIFTGNFTYPSGVPGQVPEGTVTFLTVMTGTSPLDTSQAALWYGIGDFVAPAATVFNFLSNHDATGLWAYLLRGDDLIASDLLSNGTSTLFGYGGNDTEVVPVI
jgi:hypothetical protein